MTEREAQIFNLIKKEPMISQEEIAARIGVKRSSVSVYISNLLKEGRLKGRGYIVDEDQYCVVIGAANMDVNAISDRKIERSQNNSGNIRLSPGGAARNIAESLARLGINVKLVACLGSDMFGRQLMMDSEAIGIDVSECMICEDAMTSLYVEMSDGFDLKPYGITNSAMTDRITPPFIEQKLNVLKKAEFIIVDSNLPLETIEFILSNFDQSKVVCAIGSVVGAQRISNLIKRFGIIRMNADEALVATNADFSQQDLPAEQLRQLVQNGGCECYVAQGNNTVHLCTGSRITTYALERFRANNHAGAGESFIAGILYGKMNGFEEKERIEFALGCSAMALMSPDIINKSMCVETVKDFVLKHRCEDGRG